MSQRNDSALGEGGERGRKRKMERTLINRFLLEGKLVIYYFSLGFGLLGVFCVVLFGFCFGFLVFKHICHC